MAGGRRPPCTALANLPLASAVDRTGLPGDSLCATMGFCRVKLPQLLDIVMRNAPPRGLTLSVVCLASLDAAAVLAQETITPDQILSAPGTTVARSMEGVPANQPRAMTATTRSAVPGNRGTEVVGYAIERVEFAQASVLDGFGPTRSAATRQAWRVRVSTNNLPARSSPIIVCLGDKSVRRGIESDDLSSVGAVTTDASLIANGQPVGMSYQSDPDRRLDSKTPIRLESKP